VLLKDKKLLNAKVNQYPIIYLAVRSGHYDVVEFLLKAGCSLNFKECMSTPMHCAAYYGHYNLIPLLLMYGMPVDIKNIHGKLPIEEAASPEIEKLLTIVKESRIQRLN
jgi:ankyrin repeat protein